MVDAPTALAVTGGFSYVGKDLASKILGPTCSYMGEGFKELAQDCTENIKKIFLSADKKLSLDMADKGSVPPSVLKGVLSEGSFCDDPIGIEYFGGVLASSKTEDSIDNRGASINALISRLSNYQLRAHYIFYCCFKHVYKNSKVNPDVRADLLKMEIYIPFNFFCRNLESSNDSIFSHLINGLSKEDLIGPSYASNAKRILNSNENYSFPEEGLLTPLSLAGIELFLWAHGKGTEAPDYFFSPDFEIEMMNNLVIDDLVVDIETLKIKEK